MNAEVKELWRKDLLDNQDKQGTGALHPDDPFFCCLGRLCHLYDPGRWVWQERLEKFQWVASEPVNQDDPGVYHLPGEVMKWAGLDSNLVFVKIPNIDPVNQELREKVMDMSEGVEFYDGYVNVSLAYLNDNGFTFEQIAEIIRKYL